MRGFAAIAALVGLWAVVENLYRIGSAPPLADEPIYATAGWRYLTGGVGPPLPVTAAGHLTTNPDNFEHPPLVKYLFGAAEWVAGTPHGLTAPRVVSALATLVAAAVVARWVGGLAGRWTGLLAGALLAVLPQAASGARGRFDRFAMLDPVASAVMVLSVVAAWTWAHRTGRAAWAWAVLTGVAIGCAAGAKENGFLGAVGPVAVAVAAPLAGRRFRAALARGAQAAVALVTSLATFAGLYLPFPHPVARIRYLVAFQLAHSRHGHLVLVAGHLTTTQPWWANLWFAAHGYGPALTAFLGVAVLCAVVLRRDGLVGWCLASLAAPLAFHCLVARVALGFYWVMWTPMPLVLVALGAAEAFRRICSRRSRGPSLDSKRLW